MTSKEALKRIKKSHYVAMDCMGIEEPDVETEEAIKTIEKDLDLLAKIEKVIQDYCYIDDFPQGKVIRMFVEENEESNEADFYLLKEVIENDN